MSQKPRKHRRVPFEDATIIKMVKTTNPEKMDEGESIMCSTVDVSVKGLRLGVPRDLPVGSRVEVWVKSKAQEGTLKVMGKLIWCKKFDGLHELNAGIEVLEHEHSDYIEYQKRVVKFFLPPPIDNG